MSEPFERLREARVRAGYATAVDAANAMGVREPTYVHHENGTRGLSRSAPRYAKFYRVSLDWLVNGRGTPSTRQRPVIELAGTVGAGDAIYGLDGDTSTSDIGQIDFIDPGEVRAVEVVGNSQYPRYREGEYVLIAKEPRPPESLVGRYAVIVLDDGRQLIKLIRKSKGSGYFDIWSHNADPEDDVEIVRAYPVLGTLAR